MSEPEGFTPVWVVLARFMVSQCRQCAGGGMVPNPVVSDGADLAVPCPDCKEVWALITKPENPSDAIPEG